MLVDEFLQQDPEFARTLQISGIDREEQTLSQMNQVLHGKDWFLFLAMLFNCLAFGRIISDTSWDVSPLNFIITALIAAVFWLVFLIRIVRKQRKLHP